VGDLMTGFIGWYRGDERKDEKRNVKRSALVCWQNFVNKESLMKF